MSIHTGGVPADIPAERAILAGIGGSGCVTWPAHDDFGDAGSPDHYSQVKTRQAPARAPARVSAIGRSTLALEGDYVYGRRRG